MANKHSKTDHSIIEHFDHAVVEEILSCIAGHFRFTPYYWGITNIDNKILLKKTKGFNGSSFSQQSTLPFTIIPHARVTIETIFFDGKEHKLTSALLTSEADNELNLILITGEQVANDTLSSFFSIARQLIKEKITSHNIKERIEKNHQFTFAIINSLKFGVLAVNPQGDILYANDTACQSINIRRRELIKIPVREIVPAWDTIYQMVGAGNRFQNEEAFFNTSSGKIKYNLTASSIADATGQLIGLVVSFRELKNVYQLVNKYTGMQARLTFDDIIGKSKTMRQLIEYAITISDSPSTILIEGESGTGKEVFAQSIHNASSRKEAGFVAINCAAIPENLIESELFGYDDGAFTGAKKGGHPGKFELANGGTLFLDEIGDMRPDMQAKLLRAIQESAITRVGGEKIIPIDVRIIAATNKDLKKEVNEGTFRLDLFYRLSVIPLKIPPLRERKGDLPSLIRFFLNRKSLKLQRDIPKLKYALLQQLLEYQWPGNVRELENFIEQLVNLDGNISLENLKKVPHPAPTPLQPSTANTPKEFIPHSIQEMEKRHIIHTLQHFNGNHTKAAQSLNIGRNTLYEKIKKYHLSLK